MKYLLLLCIGCASLPQYGQSYDGDTACAPVGRVAVRLRPGAFQSCDSARDMVSQVLHTVPLGGEWTVIFSAAEPAGWDIGEDLTAHFYRGMTYPGAHVIALSGNSSELLAHEFGHAQDTEEHRPNRRDR